jgi:hypothetical protein
MAGAVEKQKGDGIISVIFFKKSNLFKEPVVNESDSVFYGGRSRSRTYDRPVMSRWLYQLSYTPLPYDETYYNKRTVKKVNQKRAGARINKIPFPNNFHINSRFRKKRWAF